MKYQFIIARIENNVGIIQLDRAEVLNALSTPLMLELGRAIEEFDRDEKIGAIVICGNEKAFAAGADIPEMHHKKYMEAYLEDFISSEWETILGCRKPIIAAVAGFALGGGCELAMMCDFILAAQNAKFGQPEVNLGIIPGAGGTQRLTRIVGKSKAMEMCLSGRMMNAEEAERCGLVSRILPVSRLLEEAIQTAQKIADKSKPSIYMIKESINRCDEVSLKEGLRFERRLFHSLFATEDQKEGMSAFIEKRQPKWRNC